MTDVTTADPAVAAVGVVDLALKAVQAFGRTDLEDRLKAARHGLEDRGVHIVVVGEFKQGKSSLVNALLNVDVCPVDDDIATAVPTFLAVCARSSRSGHRGTQRQRIR